MKQQAPFTQWRYTALDDSDDIDDDKYDDIHEDEEDYNDEAPPWRSN